MKKSFIVFVFIILYNIGYSQGKPLNSMWYYPDGKKYTGKSTTVYKLNLEFDKFDRIYVFRTGEGITTVGFKLFTDIPLWVMIDDTSKIKSAISKFDLDKFYNSPDFEYELQNHIKDYSLDDAFLLQTFGKPDDEVKYFDNQISIKDWTYYNIRIKLTLKNGVVISYIKF